MDTRQINNALRRNPVTRTLYMGCYPADKIPKMRQFPSAMVVNLDPAHMPGTHWVAIYAPEKRTAYYMDSLGKPAEGLILDYLRQNFGPFHRFWQPIQSPSSSVCGQYAIFFIYTAALGFPVTRMRALLLRTRNPDKYVYEFVRRVVSYFS